jgi:hypothetical protein
MDVKVRLLLVSVRKLLIEFVATIEDFLDVPYDKSGLAKRRQKVGE